MQNGISSAVIRRMPRYYRYLEELLDNGVDRISSGDLSKSMHITASQIRQDLNNFGGFGQQGYGYNVKYLHDEIGKILGLDQRHNIIVIGVGNLGQALLNYNRWDYVVGEIVMAFDTRKELIGKTVKGIPVYDVAQLEQRIPKDCRIAIVAISGDAQQVVERLHKCGVIGLVDFTHTHIQVPKGMLIKSIDIVSNIQELVFETNTLKKFQ